MLRTLFWLMCFFINLLSRVPHYLKAKRLGKQGRIEEKEKLVYEEVKNWSTTFLKKTKINLTIEGAENLPPKEETVVYVANHQSYLDIPVMLAAIEQPCALLAKKELGKIPLLSPWIKLLGCVLVERDDVRASMKAMRACEETLEGGRSIIVCPEGTRSKSDTMGEFKAGAVRIAFKTGVRIIPLAIDGTWRALEGNGYRLQKCDVRLIILPAVESKNLTKETRKSIAKELQSMISTAKDKRA